MLFGITMTILRKKYIWIYILLKKFHILVLSPPAKGKHITDIVFKLKTVFKNTLLTFPLGKQLNAYCHFKKNYYCYSLQHMTLLDSSFSPRKVAGVIGSVSRQFEDLSFGGIHPVKLFLQYYTLCLWNLAIINAVYAICGKCL